MIKKHQFVYLWLFLFFLSTLPSVCAESASSEESGAMFVSAEEARKLREDLVDYSKCFLGCPYRSGGMGPNSFDCSGFVCTMSRDSIGVPLPRTSRAIFNKMTVIEKENLEPGDLVFFKTTSTGSISHVGIFIGENKFIHAASDGPETGVIITSLNERFWKNTYFASGRYLASAKIPSVDDVEKDSENVD
ncbi:MAG: C40 family peptidase [Treponema sp.]|nr:C40 family peptidase [Treponema sp.]